MSPGAGQGQVNRCKLLPHVRGLEYIAESISSLPQWQGCSRRARCHGRLSRSRLGVEMKGVNPADLTVPGELFQGSKAKITRFPICWRSGFQPFETRSMPRKIPSPLFHGAFGYRKILRQFLQRIQEDNSRAEHFNTMDAYLRFQGLSV